MGNSISFVKPHKVAMHSYRITKYNPARRDASGAFLGDDWTAYTDVGSAFDAKVLTLAEYERVERAYIGAVQAFLVEAEISSLYAKGVEGSADEPNAPVEGAAVEVEALAPLLTGLLREKFWCRLECESAFLHVGRDYYMYVGVPRRCPIAEREAAESGLFVEDYSSPYVSGAA
jgi:hypothetical protein